MAYQIILKRSAEKELEALQENPRPCGIKSLQGEERYRLRVGDYRVLYTVDDKVKKLFMLAIGHRREVDR